MRCRPTLGRRRMRDRPLVEWRRATSCAAQQVNGVAVRALASTQARVWPPPQPPQRCHLSRVGCLVEHNTTHRRAESCRPAPLVLSASIGCERAIKRRRALRNGYCTQRSVGRSVALRTCLFGRSLSRSLTCLQRHLAAICRERSAARSGEPQ